ncbi:sensor histidine kinase [Microtetraspora malaysiensis]|uniref:sensor histidine kinase n=1 Tax=Microtetraspora malaysiensis TaxID=161358 RepID=UPI00082BED15|nr:histidine kinase [Microtetraspora malaysiensis]
MSLIFPLPHGRTGPRRPGPHAIDAGIAALVLAATLWPQLTWASAGWLGTVSAVAASAPLLWRRRAPVSVAFLVGVATTALSLEQAMPPLPYGALVATYTVAARSPLRWQLPAVACWAGSLVVSLIVPGEPPESFGYLGMAFATAYALGMGTRARSAEITALRERARRLEEESVAAAARERTRIVRDMHDILTHSVGMMVVQAEAGALMVRTRPERAETAFEAIGRTGREAIGQLRHIFGVLRATVPDSTEPPPGLDALGHLAERVGRVGPAVTVETRGTPRPLPPEAEVAAYRLVQEALTNTLRHAEASTAEVVLDWSPDALRIEVADDGRGPGDRGDGPDPGGGHGLIGMRERVAACGGTFRAGPGRAGGFTVEAALPVRKPSGEAAG